MGRVLVFVVLAFVAWLFVRFVVGGRGRGDAPAEAATAVADRPSTEAIATIAQCAWCGVHVPSLDARALPDGRLYCGDAHREAARSSAASDERRP